MTSLRSTPSVGGEVEIEAGYNQLLWGQGPGNSGSNVLYGLLRPSLTLASSGVINSAKARLEFFPVSFVGLAAGHEQVQSDFDGFTYFDCEQMRCKGEISRNFLQANLGLAIGPLVMLAFLEDSRNSYSEGKDPNQSPGEFRYIVLANPKSDRHHRTQYALGWKTELGTFAGMSDYIYFEKSKQYSKMNLLVLSAKFSQNYDWMFGAGELESSELAPGAIGVFQLRYFFSPSSKLF